MIERTKPKYLQMLDELVETKKSVVGQLRQIVEEISQVLEYSSAPLFFADLQKLQEIFIQAIDEHCISDVEVSVEPNMRHGLSGHTIFRRIIGTEPFTTYVVICADFTESTYHLVLAKNYNDIYDSEIENPPDEITKIA